jgi:Holliday junction DNA helicase RuvA
MISKLRGFIDSITEDKCVIDVGGVGYLVFISHKCAAFLQQFPREKEVTLTIETVVKEDAIELYGFSNETEKTWFLELIKVQGVGAKMAQKVLGAFTIEDLAKALIAGDEKAFTRISGIGPKVAGRIVGELKNSPKKLGISGGDFEIKNNPISGKNLANQISLDALSALENLGYKRHDCLRVIDFVVGENPKITLENLITSTLRELSKNKF